MQAMGTRIIVFGKGLTPTGNLGCKQGNISMKFLEQLCLEREVVFDVDDGSQYDKYNRVLAMVFCANGTNVNQEMLINGSAIALIIPPSEFVPYAKVKVQQMALMGV